MKSVRPGIASANRRRSGSFASLIDELLNDEGALDGLAFAYTGLGEPERRALAHAILQDARDPTPALAALVAVEENPSLRHRLAGLLSRHGRIGMGALVEGTEAQGEALLIQSIPGFESESLRITWKESEIREIEIESRNDLSCTGSPSKADLARAVDTLAPLLWRHIRSGGRLPEGVERFAAFFSAG
ncbi:MAG: hypothetical protein WCE62_15020 [Polyangiales bacterium]